MAKSKTVRTLTDAEIEQMRAAESEMSTRNEEMKQRAESGADSGTAKHDVIVVSGNGLRGATWAGDTVDTIARAWKDANKDDTRSFMQVRNWIIRENGLKTINGENCEGDLSRVPNIRRGQELKLPEGNEISNLNWKYACPLPTPPIPEVPAAPPPVPGIMLPPPPTTVAPEYYPYQATTQGDNNNGLINAYETLAATGVEPFTQFYLKPDIYAREGSNRTPRTGMQNDYMNQGPRKDDSPQSSRDNNSPVLKEERHGVQGAFYAGNLSVGDKRAADPEAQARFLDGQGFTGNKGHDWMWSRGPILGIPLGGTREPRKDMNIGQTSTTVDGAIMPTYTLSTEDFVNRDIWFFNNSAQTSAPVATYDRALAYGDYFITSKEFKAKSQSLISRLEGGDTTITRAEVQDVLNTGNYAQMNVLVRDAGIQHDLQTVLKSIDGKFANYQYPATDVGAPVVLRDGVSPDIFNTPVSELGGYRLKVASAERLAEVEKRYGGNLGVVGEQGNRFDGFKGIEGKEFTGAYRAIHQRPTAVGQFIGENRATLVRDSQDVVGQKSSAALSAVLGTAEAPNAGGTAALWAQAAERPEIATALANTLSQAYNNPKLFGFKDRNEVASVVSGLTGLPTLQEREKAGKGGDKNRNANDQIMGDSDGRIGVLPSEMGGYISAVQGLFGGEEGRMQDPQAFAKTVAARVANDPLLQAQTAYIFNNATTASKVALLQTIGADPRVEANYGPGQSMRAIAAASGASLDRDSAFFQGVVGSEVYSRSGYSDVNVSARGYVQDWVATYAGRVDGGTDPIVRSNVDMSKTEDALARGDKGEAFRQLIGSEQAKISGSGQLVVESMRYNPALSANLITATLLRDPAALDSPIQTLRDYDKMYKGGARPLIGNLFGALDEDKYGQAAGALEKSQKKMRELNPETLEAARNGDAKALKKVAEAAEPWNKFTADMMKNPTGKGAHLRYAAHEQVWDAIAHDPRAQAALLETVAAEPQLREAAVEMLRLTPMQQVDMREQQFIGKRNKDKTHAIPAPVSGPAINAASGMYVDFVTDSKGKVSARVDAAALVAPSFASVAASAAAVQNSAAATLASGGSIDVASAPSLADGNGNPLPAVSPEGFIIASTDANGVHTLLTDGKGNSVPAVDAKGYLVAGVDSAGNPVLAYDANNNPILASAVPAPAAAAPAVSATSTLPAASAPGAAPAAAGAQPDVYATINGVAKLVAGPTFDAQQAAAAAGTTASPASGPSASPASGPSASPASGPAASPASGPAASPASGPSASPASGPSASPASGPSASPASGPSASPASGPAASPASGPAASPASGPSASPASGPAASPAAGPATAAAGGLVSAGVTGSEVAASVATGNVPAAAGITTGGVLPGVVGILTPEMLILLKHNHPKKDEPIPDGGTPECCKGPGIPELPPRPLTPPVTPPVPVPPVPPVRG